MHRGRGREKHLEASKLIRRINKKCGVTKARRVQGITYAISIVCVCSVPILSGYCWGAAPAAGCRVGRSSGNDHVTGGVQRVLLHEVITWPMIKTSKKSGRECICNQLLFGNTSVCMKL